MAKYRLPCTWTVVADIIVEADSLEEAIDAANEAPYPDYSEQEPLADSFTVDQETMRNLPNRYGKIE